MEKMGKKGDHDCIQYLKSQNEKMKMEYDKLKAEKEKVERELQTKNDTILALNTGMQSLNEYHEV